MIRILLTVLAVWLVLTAPHALRRVSRQMGAQILCRFEAQVGVFEGNRSMTSCDWIRLRQLEREGW